MNKRKVRYLQGKLSKSEKFAGAQDGILGPQTLAGIDGLVVVPKHWSKKRKATGAVQYFLVKDGYDVGQIDGYWGPQTDSAWLAHKGSLPTVVTADEWPTTDYDDLVYKYGLPGTNQARVTSPYPLYIAWDTSKSIRSFQCHEVIVEPSRLSMQEVLDYYGPRKVRELRLDMFGGCFNIRHTRGGTRPSTHSWGISIDWDPARNRLNWGSDRAAFARDEYKPWHEIWESHGFLNMGKVKNYDWMHHRFSEK